MNPGNQDGRVLLHVTLCKYTHLITIVLFVKRTLGIVPGIVAISMPILAALAIQTLLGWIHGKVYCASSRIIPSGPNR